MENYLIFDTETCGLVPKGADYKTDFEQFPHIVQLSWYFNGEYHDYIIKPEVWTIPEEAAKIHGITTEIALEKGTPMPIILARFIRDCYDAEKLIAHNSYFDISVIKANLRREFGVDHEAITDSDLALDKSKRIDTMMKTIKFVGAKFKDGKVGKFPTLVELYTKLFGETFNAHNALDDVKATKRCYEELIRLKII